MGFDHLGLSPELLGTIAENGYTEPTPVQEASIPIVLAGHDLLAIAQTGTGKTGGFTLPMIDRLARGRARARMPRSLILSPTRELAGQTADYFDKFGSHTRLSHVLLIGGVGLGAQEKELERGVDVLIATPGRLLDQFERGKVMLTSVELLVIDEADRMLDMGFIPDVERIASLLLKRPQTLLFSATMPKEVRGLAERFLNDPKEVSVARPATTSEQVDDVLVPISNPRNKSRTLSRLIEREQIDKAIIFCNRKRSVSSLKTYLKRRGLNASDIHGDLDQSDRNATLDAFKADTIKYLVATDVAARGLDVQALPFVINYDVPINPDDYVHRIGRTGRAGQTGRAFTFVQEDESKQVAAINKHTGRDVPIYPDAAELDTSSRRAPAPADEPVVQEEVVIQEEATEAPVDKAAKPSKRREKKPGPPSNRQARKPDTPVLGLGDHVPAFLLRPVPLPSSAARATRKTAETP